MDISIPALPNDMISQIMINTHPYIVMKDLSNISTQYNTVYNKTINVYVDEYEPTESVKEWRYLQTKKNIGDFPIISLLTDQQYSILYNAIYPIAEFPYNLNNATGKKYGNYEKYDEVVITSTQPIQIITTTQEQKNILIYIDHLMYCIIRGYQLNYTSDKIQPFIDKIFEYSKKLGFNYDGDINMRLCYIKNNHGRVDDHCQLTYLNYENSLLAGMAGKIQGITISHDPTTNSMYVNYKDLWTEKMTNLRLYYIILNSDFPVLVINMFMDFLKTDQVFMLSYTKSENDIRNYVNSLVFEEGDEDDEDEEESQYSKSMQTLEFIIGIYCLRKDFNKNLFKYLLDIFVRGIDQFQGDDPYPIVLNRYIFTLNNKEIFYAFYQGTSFQKSLKSLGVLIYQGGINSVHLWNSISWYINILSGKEGKEENRYIVYYDIINEISYYSTDLMNIITLALKSNSITVLEHVVKLLSN